MVEMCNMQGDMMLRRACREQAHEHDAIQSAADACYQYKRCRAPNLRVLASAYLVQQRGKIQRPAAVYCVCICRLRQLCHAAQYSTDLLPTFPKRFWVHIAVCYTSQCICGGVPQESWRVRLFSRSQQPQRSPVVAVAGRHITSADLP